MHREHRKQSKSHEDLRSFACHCCHVWNPIACASDRFLTMWRQTCVVSVWTGLQIHWSLFIQYEWFSIQISNGLSYCRQTFPWGHGGQWATVHLCKDYTSALNQYKWSLNVLTSWITPFWTLLVVDNPLSLEPFIWFHQHVKLESLRKEITIKILDSFLP